MRLIMVGGLAVGLAMLVAGDPRLLCTLTVPLGVVLGLVVRQREEQ